MTDGKGEQKMTTVRHMISLVDFDAFYESVKITAEVDEKKINKKYVKQYLKEWAEAKKHIFKMLGHKLTCTKQIDIAVDPSITKKDVLELAKKYPQYAAAINWITGEEYSENKIDTIEEENGQIRPLAALFPKYFKKGSKASRVLSQIFHDEQFDIELSKILQNRTVKGNIVLSIDPTDYVMMATNTHKQGSCMDIIKGFNKVAGFTLMRDKGTIIGYLDHGKKETFSNAYGSFSWPDKIFRQLVIVSNDSKSFVLGHYLGSVSEQVRNIWCDEMCKMLKIKNVYVDDHTKYARQLGSFYYDSYYYKEVKEKGTEHEYEIGVKDLICICCGKRFTDLHSYGGWLECNKKGCTQ